MIRVGLTGNIGSGKTTVAKVFEILGAAVFNADEEAKNALNEQQNLSELQSRFGTGVIGSDHKVDRPALAGIIFGNPDAINFVNNLIHPVVRKRFDEFCWQNAHYEICIYEAAILIETGFYRQLQKTVLVTAPEEIRVERVLERDKIAREMVQQRMNNQWTEDRKMPFADFIVVNDGLTPVLRQCIAIRDELTISGNFEPQFKN